MPRTSIVVQLSRIVDKRILPHRNSRSVARSGEAMEVGRYHHARLTSSNPNVVRLKIHNHDNIAGMFTKLRTLRPRQDFPASFKHDGKNRNSRVQVCAGAFHYYFKSSLERVMRTIVSRHEINKRFELFNQMFSMNATKLCTQTRC